MKTRLYSKQLNDFCSECVIRIKHRYFHHLRKFLPSLKEQYRLESLVGPTNCWEQLMAYQVILLKDIGLGPHHTLLDMGCGPLAGGIKIIGYLQKGNYVGVDIRQEPLDAAYHLISKYKLSHKNPLILHSDTFGKNELNGQAFDYIWCSQLMYHFDEIQTKELFKQVAYHLTSTGAFVFDIIAESEWNNIPQDARWRGFPFYLKNTNYYEDLAGEHNLKCSVHGSLAMYGYPEKEGLRKNKVLILKKDDEL